ncbi:hypothetical protein [Methanoregula sp.]|jgi:hypothetical protein|uniref:hypothetical protein n=1 Tax=Methanoregula sp. TaxID=2052170 RepID=UPI00356817E5
MISIENYNQNRGIYSPLVEHNGCICGYWLTGNDYRGNGYYGGYPPNYLKRIKLLFPDVQNVLHIFAGMTKKGTWPYEVMMDSNPECKPDRVGDVTYLLPTKERYELIVADPPYEQNHEKYGTPRVNKRRIVKYCAGSLVTGGCLVWLDTRIPMWSKADGWSLRGTIGLNQSTQHLTRTITILERV